MIKTVRTTTIKIGTIDYAILAQQVKVVRYRLDANFRFSQDRTRFGRLHNQLKEQLSAPYHFFSNDNPTPSIFVAYGPTDMPVQLDIKLGRQSGPLSAECLALEQLPRHLLIKLLLARYFMARRSSGFYSHNKYYIEAKRRGNTFTCLEIELRERNGEIRVMGHATRFIKQQKKVIGDGHQWIYPYFRRLPTADGSTVFSQLKPSQVLNFTGDTFAIFRRPKERATLDYHSRKHPEATRGYVLYQFITGFIDYIHVHGIEAHQKLRTLEEFKPCGDVADLPVAQLGTVNVLDLRLNTHLIPITTYQKHLTRLYPQLSFAVIESLSQDVTRPTLILLDYQARDFDSDGVFPGQVDPYKELYGRADFRLTPKQSINVNLNDQEMHSDTYLTYPCVLEGETAGEFELRFAVSLNQLFLKDTIINQRSIIGRLPGFVEGQVGILLGQYALDQYAYIRKQTIAGDTYVVFAYVDQGEFIFVDTRSPEGKQQRDAVLNQYGLDWYTDILEPFQERHYCVDKAEQDLPAYDFILGSGLVVEIEDINERVLYEYDEIEDRQVSLDEQHPIRWFHLTPHAASFRPTSPVPTETAVVQGGLFDGEERSDISGNLFFAQLQAFDAFLDEIAATRSTISFNELASGQHLTRISEMLGLPPDTEYKIQRKKIKGMYQQLGYFPSDKAKDVQTFSGIWFDNDNCFMVGDPQGLNTKQSRAHLIRRFTVYQAAGHFDPRVFLTATAVKFVRYQQYTVLPYPFHLIDIFLDTQVLRYNE